MDDAQAKLLSGECGEVGPWLVVHSGWETYEGGGCLFDIYAPDRKEVVVSVMVPAEEGTPFVVEVPEGAWWFNRSRREGSDGP